MQTYYAHSTIRAKRGASGKIRPYLRTNVYSKPSFTKASKAKNRRTSGNARSVARYHELGARRGIAMKVAGGIVAAGVASRMGNPASAMRASRAVKGAASIGLALIAGKTARNRLRKVGLRRSAIPGGFKYVSRKHGTQSVRHARRTRRNYKGQFAGSY